VQNRKKSTYPLASRESIKGNYRYIYIRS